MVFMALLCLVVPIQWFLSVIVAAAFHELCHILAIKISGGYIRRIIIGVSGSVIDAVPISQFCQLFCILAGPAGSLLLLAVSPFFPRISICGLFHGLFNLLPIYPLDGGRALHCLCSIFFSTETVSLILWICYAITCFFILGITIWLSFFRRLGFGPVIFALLLLSRASAGKFPCNEGEVGVQ